MDQQVAGGRLLYGSAGINQEPTDLRNLVDELIEVSSLLRQYDQERVQQRSTKPARDALIGSLEQVIAGLSNKR